MNKYLKIILSILLLLCLAPMPYGYYIFVRVLVCIAFIAMAIHANVCGRNTLMWICIGIIILFQPIIKFHLGRELWNTVDVVLAVGLIISCFTKCLKD